ncbi:MAG: precorrin-6y C5,15-methyltransferase (decarboxylating) subunit CbiE [Filifactor alocis]|nr:precorrin-6y C5,15-methyltransferase (decarboxylating) subunit CbiE [Filifactor alocis]
MICVVGMGPGTSRFITEGARLKLEKADHIIGHARHKKDMEPVLGRSVDEYVSLQELKTYLLERADEEVVVLASGDPCVYGIAEYLTKFASQEGLEIEVINGISSIQYLFAKIGLSMNEVYLTSSHGKNPDFDLMASLSKVGMVTDEKIGPFEIAQEMLKRGKNKRMYIGENLAYERERITVCLADEVECRAYGMNVTIMIEQ